jgi:hypothetical protein
MSIAAESRESENFYHQMRGCASFSAALEDGCALPVPEDWLVIGTDVEDSTMAIADGRYKDVTVAGAIGTIAIANITGSLVFPFFFGGDGMVFLLPGRFREAVLDVLADVSETVKQISGLSLRAGLMTVGALRQRGHELLVGKVHLTDRYAQAVAGGTALAAFDALLKEDGSDTITRPPEAPRPDAHRADFRGFSCRWQDIRSARGETVSLIIQARPADLDASQRVLLHARRIIDEIVGDETAAHPLTVANQTATADDATAGHEARYRGRGTRGPRVLLHRLRIAVEVGLVRFAQWSGLPIRAMGKRLKDVREDNIRNADIQKLDGAMKMVLSLTPEQREEILAGLEAMRSEGLIWYGSHRSDRAIMTCLIHTNNEDEVHFVDAADGGYAMAARVLKEQIATNRR